LTNSRWQSPWDYSHRDEARLLAIFSSAARIRNELITRKAASRPSRRAIPLGAITAGIAPQLPLQLV
jgi:hypothetical protein